MARRESCKRQEPTLATAGAVQSKPPWRRRWGGSKTRENEKSLTVSWNIPMASVPSAVTCRHPSDCFETRESPWNLSKRALQRRCASHRTLQLTVVKAHQNAFFLSLVLRHVCKLVEGGGLVIVFRLLIRQLGCVVASSPTIVSDVTRTDHVYDFPARRGCGEDGKNALRPVNNRFSAFGRVSKVPPVYWVNCSVRQSIAASPASSNVVVHPHLIALLPHPYSDAKELPQALSPAIWRKFAKASRRTAPDGETGWIVRRWDQTAWHLWYQPPHGNGNCLVLYHHLGHSANSWENMFQRSHYRIRTTLPAPRNVRSKL